jgi:hypothetical protein
MNFAKTAMGDIIFNLQLDDYTVNGLVTRLVALHLSRYLTKFDLIG